jgi:hypothetical protein
MKWPHERAFYRIEYPTRERPSLELIGEVYDVIDVCESGVRYLLRGGRPKAGDSIHATVRFRRGDVVAVTGEIVRVQDGYAAVRLDPPGIPLRIILEEQKFLLRHYPRQPH